MSWRKKLPAAATSDLGLELVEVDTLFDGTEMVTLRGKDRRIGKFTILLECVSGRPAVRAITGNQNVPDAQFLPVARRVEAMLAA